MGKVSMELLRKDLRMDNREYMKPSNFVVKLLKDSLSEQTYCSKSRHWKILFLSLEFRKNKAYYMILLEESKAKVCLKLKIAELIK